MTPKHFEQDAVVCKQSSLFSPVRRGLSAWHLSALVCAALAAVSCTGAELEPEHTGRTVEVGGSQQALFANGDFESGPAGYVTPPNWTLTPYLNPGVTRQTPQTRAGLNLRAGGSLQANTLYTASLVAESQPDAVLGGTASLHWPKYGHYAVYLNSNSGDSGNVNSITQTMTLGVRDVDPYDGKPHIRFAVAPVLENPGHPADQQPYYFVQVRNTTTNSVLYVDYNASGELGVPWKISNSIYYTDWQLKDIATTSTQAALGDSVELEIIAAGCSPGGHYGRLYVDGVGASIPGLSVAGSGPAAANAGSDITYTLAFKNGGTGAAGNVTVEFNTPPNTTFQSINAPGAICSQPAMGSAGLITCVYGVLEPGENDSLIVTVQIVPSASGTITAGTYQISANNASKLLGSKIYTAVTKSVTYADVAVTISNGNGAVNWGQVVTYNIGVTNSGPNAVTGGTLTDTKPAELEGVTWTCSGTGGGSCASSGSDNIADNAINLPMGASVTYVVSASLASSGTATRVVNTASFTMPASMSDPQPSDNAAADSDPIGPTRVVTVTKAGPATGKVVSVPNAIACDAQCTSPQSATFADGQDMILAATPTRDKVFTGWSLVGCPGTANCVITLTADTPVTATFDDPPTCTLDSGCSAGRYCNGNTCVRRLANGSLIPNDSLHNGTCTAAPAVCVSTECNTNTNPITCGQSCTADANCTTGSSYCGNLFCATKLPGGTPIPSDGLHNGTCTSAAAVCLSGLCNTTAVTCGNSSGSLCTLTAECATNTCKSMHCVPAANGCYVDSECSSTQYCNRTTFTCAPKLSNGMPIPTDGLHDGTCSDESAAQVCVSAACNPVTNTCAPCVADADCDDTRYCSPSVHTCVTKLSTGVALPTDTLHDGKCSEGLAAAVCQSAACNATTDTCASANGTACSSANTCVSNACGSNQQCGRAVGESGCTPATQTLDCQSGYCAPSGVCVPPSGCSADGDCPAESYCNPAEHVCASKLAPGAALPSDALHDGKCVDALAQVACSSGECNPVANTCAVSAPGACTAPEQCTTGVCSSNSKCGVEDGSGPCAQDVECQSGKCLPEMDKCIAPESGCTEDSDCPAEQHCDRTNVMCVDDLSDGTSIPGDSGSDGKCDAEVAKIVCASGACNPDNDTCAKLGGAECDSDEQCGAARCIDGKCGSPDASESCSEDNASIVCQSGKCQTDLGRCVAAENGCSSDGDCASSEYCDATILRCVPKMDSGGELPDDGVHDTECTAEVAKAVCSSGTCNEHTDRCALVEGKHCASAGECGSNACLEHVCVPTSEAPPGASLGGGRCSVLHVGQTGDDPWSIFLLTALGLVARQVRRRSHRQRER